MEVAPICQYHLSFISLSSLFSLSSLPSVSDPGSPPPPTQWPPVRLRHPSTSPPPGRWRVRPLGDKVATSGFFPLRALQLALESEICGTSLMELFCEVCLAELRLLPSMEPEPELRLLLVRVLGIEIRSINQLFATM